MKKSINIFILTVLSSTILFGETISLDFNEALSKAYNNDYDYKNSLLDENSSKQNVSSSFKSLLPALSYSGSERYTQDVPDPRNYTNAFIVSQPVFQGGALIASLNIARNQNKQAGYKVTDATVNTYMTTLSKYTDVLTALHQTEIYKTSLENIKKQYDQAKRKYELDLIANIDVLPLNTQYLNVKSQLLKAENSLEATKADLKNYLGIKSSDDLVLKELDSIDAEVNNIDLNSDISYARENNRAVKISELDIKNSESQATITRADFLPRVNATASKSSAGNTWGESKEDFSTVVGVTVSMSLFQFGKSINDYKKSSNNVEKSKNTAEKVKNDIELKVRNGYTDLLTYQTVIEQQKATVLSAEESYNAASKRYEIGLTNTTDLLTYQNTYLLAQLNLIIANYNYLKAYAQYQSLLK